MKPGLPDAARATALLLLAGWLHGAVPRAEALWQGGADNAASGAAGPLELLVAGLATAALWRGTVHSLGIPAFALAAALLVPSAMMGNAALLLFAVWLAWRSNAEARAGAWLFAGLAACGLWWGLGERFLAGAPLRADAAVTEFLLGHLLPGVTRDGNVVGVAGGHRIVVLAGCSTLNGLPLVLLGLAALSLRQGRLAAGFWWRAGLTALLYAAANIARLTLLGVSSGWYHLGHSPDGQMAFDAFATLLPLVLAGRGGAARLHPAPTPGPRAGAWRLAVMAGLAALGLLLMAQRITRPAGTPREMQAEQSLQGFLAAHGWTLAGRQMLTGDGSSFAMLFSHDDCPARLAVAAVPHGAEAASMTQAALGAGTRWLANGELLAAPPLRAQFWQETQPALLARLGAGPDRTMPLVAVALSKATPQAGCAPPPDAAWVQLAQLP